MFWKVEEKRNFFLKKMFFFVFSFFGYSKKGFQLFLCYGCQGKSFRYRPKKNFDTCLRSVGLIFTEIWPFSWKPTFWTSNFFLQFLTLWSWVKMNGSHRKWHNSMTTRLSYLGEVAKFSLVQYLKLFLDTQKIYWVEKTLGEPNFLKKSHFFCFAH